MSRGQRRRRSSNSRPECNVTVDVDTTHAAAAAAAVTKGLEANPLPDLPFLASLVLTGNKEDIYQETSDIFKVYNLVMGIGFLFMGLNLRSEFMMLVNLVNAAIRFNLGVSVSDVDKMLRQAKRLVGLSALSICYLGLLKSAEESFSAEGFEWWGQQREALAEEEEQQRGMVQDEEAK
eukprot:scaffold3821_cov127-Cylindrotheca_fusiformis.AAC.8